MSAVSLTQAEAEKRAALLSVERYDIDVDLTDLPTGPEVRCVSTVTFTCREPGAETFIDCAAEVVGATLNGMPLAPPEQGRITLTGLAEQNTLRVESVQADTTDGEGVHKAVDPVRRRGVRLDVLRAGRGALRLGLLRPARPQGAARVHRDRAGGVDGHQQLRRPADRAVRRRPAAGRSPTRRRCRPTTRSSTPGRSTRSAARPTVTTWGSSRGGRWRTCSNATPTRSSP